MNHKSGVTVTIIVSLLTLLCATICSAAGIYVIADHGLILDLHSGAGIVMVGLGVMAWIAPPLASLLPGRRSERDIVDR